MRKLYWGNEVGYQNLTTNTVLIKLCNVLIAEMESCVERQQGDEVNSHKTNII